MVRPSYRTIFPVISLASFGAALTLSSPARADTVQFENNCFFETGCADRCTPKTINCDVEHTDTCSKSCTDTVTNACTTSCDTQCKTNPGSFDCTSYCSDQCATTCSQNDNCGAASSTDCATDCQAQCSFTCNETPPSTTCSTECAHSCAAVDNIKCSVSCQASESKTCTVTPASCMTACNGTGGVVVCNDQVVFVADSVVDATTWFVDHIDGQFSLNVKVGVDGGCSGDQCTATVGATASSSGVKCSASPISGNTGSGALLLGGLSFVAVGVVRRRNRRS